MYKQMERSRRSTCRNVIVMNVIVKILLWISAFSALVTSIDNLGYLGGGIYQIAYVISFVFLIIFLVVSHFSKRQVEEGRGKIFAGRAAAVVFITLGPVGLPSEVNSIVLWCATIVLMGSAILSLKRSKSE